MLTQEQTQTKEDRNQKTAEEIQSRLHEANTDVFETGVQTWTPLDKRWILFLEQSTKDHNDKQKPPRTRQTKSLDEKRET